MEPLLAVSPIDGRYHSATDALSPYLSEYALIKNRVIVMIEYLRRLSRWSDLPPRQFTRAEHAYLDILRDVTPQQAAIIQAIERTGYGKHKRTNHDVKACELYLRDAFEDGTLKDVVEWLHFGLTSMDVDNIAYALMLRGAIHKIILPELRGVFNKLRGRAQQYAELPMLARTHGKPASPTTLGKEFNVFAQRLSPELQELEKYPILIKLNGASGNYNALVVGLGKDKMWRNQFQFSRIFPATFNEKGMPGFEINLVTTQIEPHDTYAKLFQIFQRINTILIDFCCDIWRYVSDSWIVETPVQGEVGSSTMPHKVNPIDFENAEGNLGMANVLFEFFSRKLPISRLQRDLSDSTVQRNFGVALAHSLVAYRSILRGMGKISANEAEILRALDEHPEVITEAYQTILRAVDYPNAYGALHELSRGKKVTLEDLREFVRGLDVPDDVKERMLAITPRNYIGLAPELARMTQ